MVDQALGRSVAMVLSSVKSGVQLLAEIDNGAALGLLAFHHQRCHRLRPTGVESSIESQSGLRVCDDFSCGGIYMRFESRFGRDI